MLGALHKTIAHSVFFPGTKFCQNFSMEACKKFIADSRLGASVGFKRILFLVIM